MKITRSQVIEFVVGSLVIGGLLTYFIRAEIQYAKDIFPGDRRLFTEFNGLISADRQVRVFESPSGRLFEFSGNLPQGKASGAIPSSAPNYYFDMSGNFVGWVGDPGDSEIPVEWRAVGEVEVISLEDASRLIGAQQAETLKR